MRKKKQKIIYPLNRKMANQIRDKEYWRAACKKNYEKNKEKILEQRRKLYAEKKGRGSTESYSHLRCLKQ